MTMNKLYFNTEELGNIETTLNRDVEEVNTIFKNIKTRDSMNSIWNGNAGDNAYTKLNEITYSYISADTDNTN